MFLVDRINSLFHSKLSRLVDVWKELDSNETTLRKILNKCMSRDDILSAMWFLVIDVIDDQIEKTFDQVNDLIIFYQKRDIL